jgi:hypothetical protein
MKAVFTGLIGARTDINDRLEKQMVLIIKGFVALEVTVVEDS